MTIIPLGGALENGSGFTALNRLDQATMDAWPQALYLCAADGKIVRFNQRATELWGRRPSADSGAERFCGSHRMYLTDGTVLPHDQCPMATALKTGEPSQNQEVVVEQPSGRRLTVLVNIAALKDEEGRVSGGINSFQDISDRKQREEQQQIVIAELNHRVKNTLATVQSMAASTARCATSIEQFMADFQARLLALGQAHELLGESHWHSANLHDLLALQIAPFEEAEGRRIRCSGPEVELTPRQAISLGMVFHELMTNAAKYGSISNEDGRIVVAWDVIAGPSGNRLLTVHWREMSGPRVEPPQRSGFGTRLIERTIKGGLDGEAELLFEPGGLQLRARIPLRS